MNSPTHYVLTIAPVKGVAPEIIRLRHILKALLRHHGFRAVSVSEVTAAPPAPPAPGHAWCGWARTRDGWRTLCDGPTQADVARTLAELTQVPTVTLPAGRHPDEHQHVADGAGGIGAGD